MSSIASPYLFRATAIDVEDDPWIAPGVHLRIHASPLLGPPTSPFMVIPLEYNTHGFLEEVDVDWTDEESAKRGVITGTNGEPRTGYWCYLRANIDSQMRVEWLANSMRPWGLPVLGARSAIEHHAFGGIGLGSIRVYDTGNTYPVEGINSEALPLEGFGEPRLLGLPIEGSNCYGDAQTGIPALEMAKERLWRGQRRCLGPPDSPNGSYPALSATDDHDRIVAHLGPNLIDGWLTDTFFGDKPPGEVISSYPSTDPGRRASSQFLNWDALHTMTADPVIARYLGFCDIFDPIHGDTGYPQFWLVAGQFAVSQSMRERLGRAGLWLDLDGEQHSAIESLLHDKVALGHVNEQFASWQEMPGSQDWRQVTLYTLAVAAAQTPPDPPPPPAIVRLHPSWNGGSGRGTWRQTLAITGQPPAGSLAFARLEADGPVSLHEQLDGYGAAALLANWSRKPTSTLGAITTPKGTGLWTPPAVTDCQLPDGMDPGAWRLWQSDEFGRWSDQTDFQANRPQRPVASAPAPEVAFECQPIAGTGPASPGKLHIRVDLPSPDALPPGALPISGVSISIDSDQPEILPVTPGRELVQLTLPAKDTTPGGRRTIVVSAQFLHAGNTHSHPGTMQREVFDPRPVLPNPTAPILIWAGRLDPTGMAELSLSWSGAGKETGYRVYLGDQRRLAHELDLEEDVLGGTAQDPPHRLHHTRALAADKICEAARDKGFAGKKFFTLLTEAPLCQDTDGLVRFRHRLPGGLRGVQFLRIVPVTPAGTEAPFDQCGLVPLAIPLDDRPPAPAVEVHPTEDGVRVRVLAYGLDPGTLARFGHPGNGKSPQFRLRRGRGSVVDALYMPLVTKEGALQPPPDDAPPGSPWTAEIEQDAAVTPAFVQHTWIAEVRYPPEPVQAEQTPEPGLLDVRPLFGPFGKDAPSMWSEPSAPASTARIPAEAPGAPAEMEAAKQADGTVKLRVGGLPLGHTRAIAPYRVVIWKQVADAAGQPRLIGDPPEILVAVSDQPTLEHIDSVGDALAFSVAIADPIGRLGAVGVISVPHI